MAIIMLDFGSGETCQNDKEIVRRMIDALADVDGCKHEVIIKWQLFASIPKESPPIEKLDHKIFDYAYRYAMKKGYKTTASIFDWNSQKFLEQYDVPFIKIACRPRIWDMVTLMPDTFTYVISIDTPPRIDELRNRYHTKHHLRFLCCIPEYPANKIKYETLFSGNLTVGISDHTDNLELFKEYKPLYYEKHFKLPDSPGLDNGPWAMTPTLLKEIL